MEFGALVLVDRTYHVLRAQILYTFCSTPINKFLSKTDWKTYKKRSATRGLPRWSPILVLLSPQNVLLRSSEGIRCISAGMIAPVMYCVHKSCMLSVAC